MSSLVPPPTTHLAPAAAAPPDLPPHIHEQILTLAVRVTAVASHWDLATTGQLLCVTERTYMPLPTKALFMHFPWIDVDHVARFDCVSTLRFLLKWSQEGNGRPIRDLTGIGQSVIDRATACGSVKSLEWLFYESGLPLGEWTSRIEQACGAGHVHVLRWWYLSGKEFKVTELALQRAAWNGQLPVLKFFFQHYTKELFTQEVIAAAIGSGHWDILNWWQSVRLPVDAADVASRQFLGAIMSHNRPVLDWIMSNPGFGKLLDGRAGGEFTRYVMGVLENKDPDRLAQFDLHFRAAGGKLSEIPAPQLWELKPVWSKVLQQGTLLKIVWMHRLWPYQFSASAALTDACASGNVYAVEWVLSCLNVTLPYRGVDLYQTATEHDHVQVLDWLVSRNIEPVEHSLPPGYIAIACAKGHIDVLEWWMTFPNYTYRPVQWSMLQASRKGHLHVLEWWRDKSGYVSPGLDFTGKQTVDLLEGTFVRLGKDAVGVIDWWLHKSGIHKLCLPVRPTQLMNAASHTCHAPVLRLLRKSGIRLFSSVTQAKKAILGASMRSCFCCLDRWLDESGLFIGASDQDEAFAQLEAIFLENLDKHPPKTLPWWEHALGGKRERTAPGPGAKLPLELGRGTTPAQWLTLARMGLRLPNRWKTLKLFVEAGDIGMLSYMHQQYGQELAMDADKIMVPLCNSTNTFVLEWIHTRTKLPLAEMVKACATKSPVVERWLTENVDGY